MNKVPVVLLGATGSVGQKLITRLADHPWFRIAALAASERTSGKPYHEAANWHQGEPLPPSIASMKVQPCVPSLPGRIAFSALDASVAGPIEKSFAVAGYIVVSNTSSHRMQKGVPLLVPEVNGSTLSLIEDQPFKKGALITNPNCVVVGLTMVLKPLLDHFGLEAVHVVTFQAISGAGFPGVPSLSVLDNVIPYIASEEEKICGEPRKVLSLNDLPITAQCNRVPVSEGHLACVSVKLQKKAKKEDLIEAWRSWRGETADLSLPSMPESPLRYFAEDAFPQPRLHRDQGSGMTVSVGRLQKGNFYDFHFHYLVHNTIRGAAGGAVFNAELWQQKYGSREGLPLF